MARVWQLLLKADGDTAAASREMRKLQRNVRQFGNGMKNVGRTLTAAVTAPIVALGVLGVQELRETMVVTRKTDAVFKSMGKSMKVTRGDLDKLVGSLESYSAIEGDIIQNAANVGLSFKALAGNPKLFEDTMKAAVDMSAALGTDLQTTMVQLGKAMQNGAKGAGALSKNGTLAKDDIAKLQKMAKDGVPIWKQQAFILDAVNKQYAGQGKNVDPVKALTVAVKNIAEALAVLLMPSIVKVSEWIQKLAKYVNGLSEEKKKWLGVALLVAAALGPLLVIGGTLVTALAAIIPVIAGVSLAMLGWVALIVAVVAALVYAYTKSETFRDTVNAAFRAVADAVSVVMADLKETLTVWVAWAQAAWKKYGDEITRVATAVWDGLRSVISGRLQVIKGFVQMWLAIFRGDWKGAWEGIKTMLGGIWDQITGVVRVAAAGLRTMLGLQWGLIKAAAGVVWEALKDMVEAKMRALPAGVRSALSGLVGVMSDVGAKAGNALKEAIRGAINWIIDKWNGLELPSISVKGKQITPSIGTPDISRFAKGGIVSGPTMALVGEYAGARSNPEVIAPLDKLQALMGGAGGRGVAIHMTVNKNVDEEMIVRKLMRELGSRRVMMGGLA